MTTKKSKDEVKVVYHRDGFSAGSDHLVRSKMEGQVCEWLAKHRIPHQHGGEVFIVKSGPSRVAHLYVPDIVLGRKNKKGKTVIIECFHSSEPKDGGTRLLTDFRKQAAGMYQVVLVVKKEYTPKGIEGIFDALISLDQIDRLAKEIS